MNFSKINFISFFVKGHPNILGLHANTIEFTKDKDLTLRGDCILGVSAEFNGEDIKKILSWEKIKVEILCENLKDYFFAVVNKDFCDYDEIVFRKSNFLSDRTLGILSNKGAKDISRELVNKLKSVEAFKVTIYEEKTIKEE